MLIYWLSFLALIIFLDIDSGLYLFDSYPSIYLYHLSHYYLGLLTIFFVFISQKWISHTPLSGPNEKSCLDWEKMEVFSARYHPVKKIWSAIGNFSWGPRWTCYTGLIRDHTLLVNIMYTLHYNYIYIASI